MQPFEVVVILLAVAVGLGVLAGWLRVPYPIPLVVGGLLLSLQPWAPRFSMPPDVVFLAFLPPLLYAAAFDTEWRLFRRQLRPISMLAVGLVLFTTALVAWAAHDWVGLGWGPAFVLGAIVSPPDAVAATAVTQRMRVPRVVSTILEGESLVNDASALVAYRVAVGAVLGGAFELWEAGWQFLLVGTGGIAIGIIGAVLVIRLHRWLERTKLGDSKLQIAVTLLTPYAVYLPAEYLHFSGVLASVTAGLWVGTRCEQVFGRELYTDLRAVWETITFLLNSLIFIVIGFELQTILNNLDDDHSPMDLLRYAAVISAVVILARLVWVIPGAYVPRWVERRLTGRGDPYPPWQLVTVVGWTGMRGVVSLAAALAIPVMAGGQPFPGRDLIQFLTFWVIFATLVGQGLTLPLLIRALGLGKVESRAVDDADSSADQTRISDTD
ncbi:MAG TPA: Na+/H+ antiporter [Fimbriiglobus sp.]|nr:Na+/H+ antiporter [Fimbriiglobus sp.]